MLSCVGEEPVTTLLEAQVLAKASGWSTTPIDHPRRWEGSRLPSSPSSGAKTSPDPHSWWITNRGQAEGLKTGYMTNNHRAHLSPQLSVRKFSQGLSDSLRKKDTPQ
jgi:hypothetical protein